MTLPPGLRTQCGLDTGVELVAVVLGPGKALCTTRTAILGELRGSQPPPGDATAARQSRAEPERGPLLAPQHCPGDQLHDRAAPRTRDTTRHSVGDHGTPKVERLAAGDLEAGEGE